MSERIIEPIRPTAVLAMSTDDRTYYTHLEDNPSGNSFFERLRTDAVDTQFIKDSDMMIAALPFSLPFVSKEIIASIGDVVLISNDRIGICLKNTAGSYVKIGSIRDVPDVDRLDVNLSLEWSE